jgi:hypothetical protein
MASGHVNRAQRPNTWLHRPMLHSCRKSLPTRSRPHMAHLYGPAARCKPKVMIWRRLVLRFCIRPIDGAFEAPGHHGYPRAFDLIRVSAPKARWAT